MSEITTQRLREIIELCKDERFPRINSDELAELATIATTHLETNAAKENLRDAIVGMFRAMWRGGHRVPGGSEVGAVVDAIGSVIAEALAARPQEQTTATATTSMLYLPVHPMSDTPEHWPVNGMTRGGTTLNISSITAFRMESSWEIAFWFYPEAKPAPLPSDGLRERIEAVINEWDKQTIGVTSAHAAEIRAALDEKGAGR